MKYVMYQQYQIALTREISTITIAIVTSVSQNKMFFLSKNIYTSGRKRKHNSDLKNIRKGTKGSENDKCKS